MAKRVRDFGLNIYEYSKTGRSRKICEKVRVLQNRPTLVNDVDTGTTETVTSNLEIIDEDAVDSADSFQHTTDENMEWASIVVDAEKIYKQQQEPARSICQLCRSHTDQPVRCQDCHSNFICCRDCESDHHNQLLHRPEIWNVSFLHCELRSRFLLFMQGSYCFGLFVLCKVHG